MKTHVHTKPDTRMFITAIFLRAKKGKQPKCPSTDKLINKMWSIPRTAKALGMNVQFKHLHEKT